MASRLPYRATTASGNEFDFDFPLHEATVSPVKVAQLLDAVLATLDRELRVLGPIGNGDLLQSLAFALAVRARMLGGGREALDALVRELLDNALAAEVRPGPANVPPATPRRVH